MPQQASNIHRLRPARNGAKQPAKAAEQFTPRRTIQTQTLHTGGTFAGGGKPRDRALYGWGHGNRAGSFGFCESFGLGHAETVGVNDGESGVRLARFKFSPRKVLCPQVWSVPRFGPRFGQVSTIHSCKPFLVSGNQRPLVVLQKSSPPLRAHGFTPSVLLRFQPFRKTNDGWHHPNCPLSLTGLLQWGC